MKLKKVIAVAGVCAMVTGMIAGCGNNSSDTSSDSSSDSKTEASSDWDASNDISVVSREDGSGTRGAFIELFGIEEKTEMRRLTILPMRRRSLTVHPLC